PDDDRLRAELAACCAAPAWVAVLTAGRPFAGVAELFTASDAAIAALSEADLATALAAHPRIGAGSTGDQPTGYEPTGDEPAGAGCRGDAGVLGRERLDPGGRGEYRRRRADR